MKIWPCASCLLQNRHGNGRRGQTTLRRDRWPDTIRPPPVNKTSFIFAAKSKQRSYVTWGAEWSVLQRLSIRERAKRKKKLKRGSTPCEDVSCELIEHSQWSNQVSLLTAGGFWLVNRSMPVNSTNPKTIWRRRKSRVPIKLTQSLLPQAVIVKPHLELRLLPVIGGWLVRSFAKQSEN